MALESVELSTAFSRPLSVVTIEETLIYVFNHPDPPLIRPSLLQAECQCRAVFVKAVRTKPNVSQRLED
jgi:hypothetical protein